MVAHNEAQHPITWKQMDLQFMDNSLETFLSI